MKIAEEFKGTNGEWKIQEPYNTFVYGSDGKLICQIKYDPFSEESTANAHLISAAPDLLDALQMCWASLQTYGNHPIIDMYCEKAINKTLGK